MREIGGLSLAIRKVGHKKYQNTFSGSDLVAFLLKNAKLFTTSEAIKFGQIFLDRKLISSINTSEFSEIGIFRFQPHEKHDNFYIALASRMQSPGGLDITDRPYHLRNYPKCFVGQDAVKWLVTNVNSSEQEALTIGQKMMRLGIFEHVVQEHDFKNEYLFYRFCEEHTLN